MVASIPTRTVSIPASSSSSSSSKQRSASTAGRPTASTRLIAIQFAMARSSSQSQSSVGAGAAVVPHGTAIVAIGMCCHRASTADGSKGFSCGDGSNMLRFYTDEALGLCLSPTMVLVMLLCFIGFGTVLHIFGKLYCYCTAAY